MGSARRSPALPALPAPPLRPPSASTHAQFPDLPAWTLPRASSGGGETGGKQPPTGCCEPEGTTLEAGEEDGRRAAKNSSCGNRGSGLKRPSRARPRRPELRNLRSLPRWGPERAPSPTPARTSQSASYPGPGAAGTAGEWAGGGGTPARGAAQFQVSPKTEESWAKAMKKLRHNEIGSDFWKKNLCRGLLGFVRRRKGRRSASQKAANL